MTDHQHMFPTADKFSSCIHCGKSRLTVEAENLIDKEFADDKSKTEEAKGGEA
jgi:hypothetical protein